MRPCAFLFGGLFFGMVWSSSYGEDIDHENKIRPSRVKGKNKCEIKIFTRGSCVINNHRLKPQVVLTFDKKFNGNTQAQQTPNQGLLDFSM